MHRVQSGVVGVASRQHGYRHDDHLTTCGRHGRALAAMLGAVGGTALIVKPLFFKGPLIVLVLLITGYVSFGRGRKNVLHGSAKVGVQGS